jgi:glucose-1-phosphate thymidylyltransferase
MDKSDDMKAVILAGGFAKRMWPLTENQSKALLPIAGRPMINHILGNIEGVKEVDEVFISTNEKFEPNFKEWLAGTRSTKNLRLVIEKHDCEERKFGAVGGLKYLIDTQKVKDDLLVIAGDNLFEFNLMRFVDFYAKKRAPLIASYDVNDKEIAKSMGVVVLDASNRVVEFQEKPAQPKSTLISTCIYLLPKEDLPLISEYLSGKNNPDAPGYFMQWLSSRKAVNSFVFSERWFDIGSFEMYEHVNNVFKTGPDKDLLKQTKY